MYLQFATVRDHRKIKQNIQNKNTKVASFKVAFDIVRQTLTRVWQMLHMLLAHGIMTRVGVGSVVVHAIFIVVGIKSVNQPGQY